MNLQTHHYTNSATLQRAHLNDLSVDLPPVSDAEDEDAEDLVFNAADKPVVAHPIFPELAQF